jgi:hypothetical protein
MKEVESEFSSFIQIDRSTSNDLISKASLVICDITSGIVYDSIFLFKKPVLAIKFNWSDGGYESSDITKLNGAENLLKDFGNVVATDEFENISKVIDLLDMVEIDNEKIDKHIFNFGNAGKIAANQIVNIKEKLDGDIQ